MHRQMQCRVLDGLQRRQHRLFIPDSALLTVRFGCFTGQGNLVNQVPFHRIGEGGFQQGVNFVDGGAGQQPLLLLIGQGLLYAVDVLPAGGLGEGSIELLEERAIQQFFLDRDLSLLRLLFGFETFPSLARFAGMVFVLVTDGVGISALHDRCHRDEDKTVYSFCLIFHIHKIPR